LASIRWGDAAPVAVVVGPVSGGGWRLEAWLPWPGTAEATSEDTAEDAAEDTVEQAVGGTEE